MFAPDTALAAALIYLAVFDGAAAKTANQPPDIMAARVEACTPCHGNKGEGTSDVYFPRLADAQHRARYDSAGDRTGCRVLRLAAAGHREGGGLRTIPSPYDEASFGRP